MRARSEARSSPSTYSMARKVLALDLDDVVEAADVGVGDLAADAHLGVEALRAAPAESAPRKNFRATAWPSLVSSAR